MKVISYTESRSNYAKVLDAVVDDREEVVITRQGKESVVMVSLDDYQSMKETMYLMSSPENHRRLLDSIEELKAGKGQAHDTSDADPQ